MTQPTKRYQLEFFLSEGLAMLWVDDFLEHGEQLWVLGTRPQRKSRECALCGLEAKGKRSYRPFGNPANRYARICKGCIDNLGKAEKAGAGSTGLAGSG